MEPLARQIKVLIVDDEKKACSNLKNMLCEYARTYLTIVGVAHNTRDAEVKINQLKPDVVFLDIEMPKENAFQFLNRIAPFDFEVIFVTAYDEYAIKAFKLNAVDYILKPIDIDEIINALQKLRERLSFKKTIREIVPSYLELSNQVHQHAKHHKITLRSVSHSEVVDFNDIYFLEAQSSYSRILFKQDNMVKEMIMSNPLADYEELLPTDIFYRIHRSYLINCNHVNRIITGDINYVVINNEYTLPVSRRRFIPLNKFLKMNISINE